MSGPTYFHQISPERPKREVHGKKVVLVEGADECWLIDHIFSQKNLDPKIFQIIEFNGKGNLRDNIDNLSKQDLFLDDEVTALAIILDADQSFAKTKYDLESAVKDAGLGEISIGKFQKAKTDSYLQLGAFIMPTNAASGALETLLMASVENDQAAIAAGKYVGEFAPKNSKDTAKRVAQVYLAGKQELSRGAGRGARKGYFDLQAGCLAAFFQFLDALQGL